MLEKKETFRLPTSGVGIPYIHDTIIAYERYKFGDNAFLTKLEKFLSLVESLGGMNIDIEQTPEDFLDPLPISGKEMLLPIARDLWDLVKKFLATEGTTGQDKGFEAWLTKKQEAHVKDHSPQELQEQEQNKEVREAVLKHGSFLIHTAIEDVYMTVFDTRREGMQVERMEDLFEVAHVIGEASIADYRTGHMHPDQMPLIEQLIDNFPHGINEIVSIEPIQEWVASSTPQGGEFRSISHRQLVMDGSDEQAYRLRYYRHEAGVLKTRHGSGVFYLDTLLPQSVMEQLSATLKKNPQLIRDIFKGLQKKTEEEKIFGDKSKGIAETVGLMAGRRKDYMLIMDGQPSVSVTKYPTLPYRGFPSPQRAFEGYIDIYRYFTDRGRSFGEEPERYKDFAQLIKDHTVAYPVK